MSVDPRNAINDVIRLAHLSVVESDEFSALIERVISAVQEQLDEHEEFLERAAEAVGYVEEDTDLPNENEEENEEEVADLVHLRLLVASKVGDTLKKSMKRAQN